MALKKKEEVIDNSKNKNLTLAYTDKFGNDYYGFVDLEKMPKKRIVACERATRYAEAFVSEKTLKQALDSCVTAGNKGDLFTMCAIIKELQYRLEFLGERESLLQVAACYYLFKDEDPFELFDSDTEHKMKLWESDKMATDFFLTMVLETMKSYSEKSPEEILYFLNKKEHGENEKRLHRYI